MQRRREKEGERIGSMKEGGGMGMVVVVLVGGRGYTDTA